MPAISLATIYTKFYHLKSGPIGACLGVSLTIGSLLGEIFAGKASDYVMYTMAKRNNDVRKPEYRLYLCTLSAIFMPVGIIIFGACVGKTGYVPPLVGLSVGTSSPHSTALACSSPSLFKRTLLTALPCRRFRSSNSLHHPLRIRFRLLQASNPRIGRPVQPIPRPLLRGRIFRFALCSKSRIFLGVVHIRRCTIQFLLPRCCVDEVG